MGLRDPTRAQIRRISDTMSTEKTLLRALVTGFEIYVDLGGRAQIQILRRGVIESKKFHNGLKVGDPIQRFQCSESKSELDRYHFTRLAQKKHWMDLLQKPLPELGTTRFSPVWEPVYFSKNRAGGVPRDRVSG